MLLRDRMEKMINELLDGHILLDEAIGEFEKLYILNALARQSDHVSKTADALGIHRNTLAKRIASYKTPPKIRKRPANGRAKKKAAGKSG
jgi:transcriptional regulator with PAS, ATPase and Fis domain